MTRINVELLNTDDAGRVTSAAQESHTDMTTAIRAAKRLAGTRKPMEADGHNTLSVVGKHGKAYVIR
jgi:hypothetical protein